MNQVDQAARRAAEALPFEVVCGDSFWLESQPFRSRVHAEKAASEFARLQERLVEAERLLVQAQESVAAMAHEFRHQKDLQNRIVACVNAMQGIPDPAKFIVDMQLAFQALRRGPELNMSNYRADDVAELNANATEAYLLMRPYLEAVVAKQALAAKPTNPPKDTKCD